MGEREREKNIMNLLWHKGQHAMIVSNQIATYVGVNRIWWAEEEEDDFKMFIDEDS